MLIVVSEENFRKEEASIINALFDEGLQRFHLRKPGASLFETSRLLEQIDAKHRSGISLHQHHELAASFGISRLHFPGKKRESSSGREWQKLKLQDFCLSTSIHNCDETVTEEFDYVFYGPVFDSISKKGYKAGVQTNLSSISHRFSLIAIGGIHENNCRQAMEMGFEGVAVLGAIWQSKTPVQQFKKIQDACNSIAQL